MAERLLIFCFFSYFSAYKCVRGSRVLPRSRPTGTPNGRIRMPVSRFRRSFSPGYRGIRCKPGRPRRSTYWSGRDA